MKPMSDLCWTFQQNRTAILRSANSSESEKTATIKAAEEHLRIVQVEQSLYKTTCDACRNSVHSHFTADGKFQPPPLSSNVTPDSNDSVHYSFDYAQQVHFPSDPLQPGPIYFLTPRKCSVFGVHCEAIPRQVNFLTDEAGECGKGANNVISCLQFFFDKHGLGEKTVFLHADNCTGQNKNNTPSLASHDKATLFHHTIIPCCRSHEVCTRLVLWSVQATMPADESEHFDGSSTSC